MTNLGKRLASPKIFFFTAIWLLVILVVGTIAQKFIGLYLSQNIYFSSWFFSLDRLIHFWEMEPRSIPVPLPGGRLAMTVMFFNLTAKLVYGTKFQVARLGTFIAHFGGLMLLVGGFITAYYSKEGSMMLFEGQSSSYFDDYHKLEVALIDTSHPDHDAVTAYRNEFIKAGTSIENESFAGTITVLNSFRNIEVFNAEGGVPANFKGMAKRFSIREKALDPQSERNRAGMMVEVRGLEPAENGVYLIIQHSPVPQLLSSGGREYQLMLRNARYPLPFGIELLDFRKVLHPGTTKAKSYSSDVNVVSADFKRPVNISMNEPLRNLGYTFYQASFVEGAEEGEASVFAVVKNAGRQFPYISSLVMSAGLMLHIVLRLMKHMKKGSRI